MTDLMPPDEGCLTAILRFLGLENHIEQEALPYRKRDDFLSPAEASFYRVLSTAVGGRAIIFAKVGLGDIFFVSRPNENQSYRNRIAQKHVDFLLCDPLSLRPLFGIELDEASHARSDRKARDEFVDQVFQAAGLPLIRFQTQSTYNSSDLLSHFGEYLGQVSTETVPAVASIGEAAKIPVSEESLPAPPLCPKCGIPMVVRTATRGEHKEKQFYGCVNFPRCREILPLK